MESTFGVIAGTVFVILGIVLIIKRKAFSKTSADAQRATFGKAGEKVAARANPAYTGALGVLFALVGAALVVLMLAGVEF